MAEANQFDVVIVGSGVSGLAAALAAHESGLRPLIIEKAGKLGGGTAWSYGLIWVGLNHLEMAAGYPDTRDQVVRYLRFLGGGYHTEGRLQTFVDKAPEAIKFFEKCGLRFRLAKQLKDHYFGTVDGTTEEGRTLEHVLVSGQDLGEWQDRTLVPPHGPCCVQAEELIAWGGMENSVNWDQALIAERAGKDLRGLGAGLVAGFVKALITRQVPMWLSAPAQRLIMEGGRATGIELLDGRRVYAAKGIVLASGGYESNPEMAYQFEGLPGWKSMFPESLTGDSIIMAAEHGAKIRQIHQSFRLHLGCIIPAEDGKPATFWDCAIVEMCAPHTIVVNKNGRRFANEAYFQSVGPKVRTYDPPSHTYPNLPCYLVFDQQFADRYTFAGQPPGAPIPAWVPRADTVEGLAERLGVDAAGIALTVARFNGFAAAGADEDFQRGSEKWRLAYSPGGETARLGSIAKPPFYGIELHPGGPASSGIDADRLGRVLHQRGHPIPGLYASGNLAAHTEFGAGYQAGLSLASGMTFSYLAIRDLAGIEA